jgi:Fe-S-cluster-containing dehydrogenase component
MRKWNLIFDVAQCTGCHNCTISIQDEYVGNDFPGYAAGMPKHGPQWARLHRRDRGAFPMVDVAFLFETCRHCDDAPCVTAARNGAVDKRKDGIVVIHPERARGQRQIAEACPYGAVHWNDELQIPQHWNFDAHLIDGGWTTPRPVQACPTGALRALKVSDEEMRTIVEAEGLAAFPDGAHRPRLYYRNHTRYTDDFAGGTLVAIDNATETCVAGARVTLSRGGERIDETTSDLFGDFRFDGLPRSGAPYRVDITAERHGPKFVDFTLTDSCWLGEIMLEPA